MAAASWPKLPSAAGAERGDDQTAGLELGGQSRHAGVTVPSTRAPLAPVAAGTLPGWPCSVR